MTQEAAVKKDTQRLQRAIVDGLEDVKAQDIQVFNTEHLSPLFERVIVASGTSNRQTKALASSVVDSVREAGFPKPRIEGQENGEWIIVDCGPAVAHIMQPAIRQYYHLEEIWGEKPVRVRVGLPKPAMPERAAAPVAARKLPPSLRRSSAAKAALREADREAAATKKAPAKKAPASRTPARPGTARPAAGKTAAQPGTARPAAGKTSAKAPARSGAQPTAKKTSAKSPAAKAPAKKAPARKAAAKKSPARR